MAKVKNPKTLSGHFHLDRNKLDIIGVLNPTLAVDTRLFVDPLLLKNSRHVEINSTAVKLYRSHFEKVIKFLAASTVIDDVAWRSARRLLEFHEIKGTCLGYGAGSIGGSGFGRLLTERILEVGKEIVDLGINDPDLFPAMALFEDNVGSDRLSDMTTNVIYKALVDFNKRVLKALDLTGEEFVNFDVSGRFLSNPYQETRTPIILVPKDILRSLPIARDWDDVASSAAQNEELRNRVNAQIGHIWASKSKRDKRRLKAEALASREAFKTLLDSIHEVSQTPYDVDADPDGLIKWSRMGHQYASDYPLDLIRYRDSSALDELNEMVRLIIDKFQQLIEYNGLNKELYKEDGKPKHESTAQRLFFAIAHSYCEASDLDISPEVDSGSGQVDFKFSRGFTRKVLVEMKLSTNWNTVSGYEKQLEVYKKSEQTMRAFYVVIDVGKMGKKDERLIKVKNDAAGRQEPLSELVFIDGVIKPSASKR